MCGVASVDRRLDDELIAQQVIQQIDWLVTQKLVRKWIRCDASMVWEFVRSTFGDLVGQVRRFGS